MYVIIVISSGSKPTKWTLLLRLQRDFARPINLYEMHRHVRVWYDGAVLGTCLSKTSPRGLPRRRDWPRCNRKRFGSIGLLPTYLRR